MAENSFPQMEEELTDAQWKQIFMAIPAGIIDRGGNPYRLTARDNTTDEITIGVDTHVGVNTAILHGFLHSMNTPVKLRVPPVTTTTVYEVGLVYDPTQHTALGGPVKLAVWTAPGDYEQGKARLIFYQITRQPNQVLTSATAQEWRQRVAPVIVVTDEAHRPRVETMLTDQLCLVRSTSQWYRLANNGVDPASWVKISNDSQLLETATHLVEPNTLVKRHSSGAVHMMDPIAPSDAANKRYVDTVGSGAVDAGQLVRRGSDGNFLVPSSPTHGQHPTAKSYVDGKTWSASDITSGTFNYARVAGSTPAWNYTVGGTYSTLAVQSDGRLGKWSSSERYKTNIEPFEADPRELLKPQAFRFNRFNPDGTVNPKVEIGTIAERSAPYIPELVEWGPDHADPEVGPSEEPRIQGWTYMTWTAVQQYLHQWQTGRVDALEAENRRLRADLDRVIAHLGLDPTTDAEGA